MKDEKKSATLTDEQMSLVSGGNTEISNEDASNKRCSSFEGKNIRKGDMKCCKKCSYYLTKGQCTKDMIPTLEAEEYIRAGTF